MGSTLAIERPLSLSVPLESTDCPETGKVLNEDHDDSKSHPPRFSRRHAIRHGNQWTHYAVPKRRGESSLHGESD